VVFPAIDVNHKFEQNEEITTMFSNSAYPTPGLFAVLFIMLAGSNVVTAQTPSAMVIDAEGNVGIGTDTPTGALDIFRTDGTAVLRLQESQSFPTNIMFSMMHSGNPGFSLSNTQSNATWQFRLGGSGSTEQFTINRAGISGPELSILASGDIRIKGSYISSSSRMNKDNIVKIDERHVLERVAQMPIYEWSYKTSPGSRHIGPMAEEYHEIFGFAGGGKGLAATDMAALALASVKALNTEVQDLKTENAMLRARNEKFDEMLERIAVLESRLTALAGYAQVE